jgi:hypothetical protein
MPINQKLQLAATKVTLLASQNPVATRLVVLTVPFLAAALAAAIFQEPAFACIGQGGSGCGDG